ncbi:hypothetical protein [Rhizobium sp. 1399]|jgi:hypothetical protein|uniref:hypothetical protein n=1 Tax=Rhizobium sp. 1399 TaxID=2817758 RepID=UPI00285C1EA6|nr:hypothetical protein [Rhizobium sp. 1399]MDR6667790.1 hypothetical protein [Rhizobium sp. 1399]
MPVFPNLAGKAKDYDGTTISVLLRAATVESSVPVKQRDVSEIRELGIEIFPGDILAASISALAAECFLRLLFVRRIMRLIGAETTFR